jgi:hypothetical protein
LVLLRSGRLAIIVYDSYRDSIPFVVVCLGFVRPPPSAQLDRQSSQSVLILDDHGRQYWGPTV